MCDTGQPISFGLYTLTFEPCSHSNTVQLHLQITLESYPTSPAELAAKVSQVPSSRSALSATVHRRDPGQQPSADAIAEQRSEDGAARQARHALGHLR